MIAKETEEPLIAQGIERSISDLVKLKFIGEDTISYLDLIKLRCRAFLEVEFTAVVIESLIAQAIELLI